MFILKEAAGSFVCIHLLHAVGYYLLDINWLHNFRLNMLGYWWYLALWCAEEVVSRLLWLLGTLNLDILACLGHMALVASEWASLSNEVYFSHPI